MPAPLPPDLAAQLDAFLQEKPQFREVADVLLKKRAAAQTPADVAVVDGHLRSLIEPSSGRGWLWFFAAMLLLVVGWNAWDWFVERRNAEAVARSVPAVAQVKRMDAGDCVVEPEGKRCLRLELEVHRDGVAPYVAVLSPTIGLEWMSRVQPGSWLAVGVQPDDPAVVLFDEQSLHVAAPTPPGR